MSSLTETRPGKTRSASRRAPCSRRASPVEPDLPDVAAVDRYLEDVLSCARTLSRTRLRLSSTPEERPAVLLPLAVVTETGFPTNAFSSSPNLLKNIEDNLFFHRGQIAPFRAFATRTRIRANDNIVNPVRAAAYGRRADILGPPVLGPLPGRALARRPRSFSWSSRSTQPSPQSR